MPKTRSQKSLSQEELSFSDDSLPASGKDSRHKDSKSLLIIDEDSEESHRESTTIIPLKTPCQAQQKNVKEEFSHLDSSSFMDLDDLISSRQDDLNQDINFDSESEEQETNPLKKAKIIRKSQRPPSSQQNPIKIEDNDSSLLPNSEARSNKRNRKVRTTINEEKIKIMEYLFPYVANQTPYKGTVLSLKDVGKIVDLGYSTILHKYRDYREKGEIEKGLLLKCKDFKRKYNKSLILETYIKKALKETEFKTAKQLAAFISENYHINANRSIISRHLNEMQREKVKVQDKVIRIPVSRKNVFVDGETLKKLKEFCLVYLGLKSEKIQFHYLTVIRFYLVGNKVQTRLERKYQSFGILDLIITATETQLKEYFFKFRSQGELLIGRPTEFCGLAYKALYGHLEISVQNHYLDISFDNQEKAFVIYPYKNGLRESDYRFKVLGELLDKRISILTVPPHFSVRNLNFVKQWFENEVIPLLKEEEFESFNEVIKRATELITKRQESLKNYANQMETSLKNF